jgi:mannosylglycoprotein endo-beta-mannosidase
MAVNLGILVWNVRGLNNPARRTSIRLFIQTLCVHLVCFQESKLDSVNTAIIAETLGPAFDGFLYLPADDTRGGIILAWRSDALAVTAGHIGDFSISAEVRSLADNKFWAITSVYGPQSRLDKLRFLAELQQIGSSIQSPWIVCGVFNLVCSAEDRSSGRINRRLVNKFRHTLNSLSLQDMPLQGRRFTWSNGQLDPLHARIDRVFFSPAWEDIFPISDLLSLSSNISDHCPLLLSCSSDRPRSRRFRFEQFWTKLPGFQDVVKEAWEQEVLHQDPLQAFDEKLKRTAKALRQWGQRKQSQNSILFQVANEVILRLDEALESRRLSEDERKLRSFLKGKCLALASLERVRLRQRARIRDLQEGDANSKYFHMKANARRRKHLIPLLKSGDRTASSLDDKLELAREHFMSIMGSVPSRSRLLNLESLNLRRLSPEEASALEAPFTCDEVRKVIMDLPSDRAPGPDGFSGSFFKLCWEIIADDLMLALCHLSRGHCQSLGCMNSSIMILLPKNEDPLEIRDYRPISLVHGFSKIFTKLLASRLAPLLPRLISHAQTAFIAGRSIHENFKLVRNTARFLHRKRQAAALLKIDISKAFDTLSWEFLLDVLHCRGFGRLWCFWISSLLSSASSSLCINGERGEAFRLARGVRQGDPLSPALFILAMDALQALIQWAVDRDLLAGLKLHPQVPRASLYADDAVIFFRPNISDGEVVLAILLLFGDASGLHINLSKSTITCIRCSDDEVTTISQLFQCQLAHFPIKYLGLPLTTGRLRRADIWPLIDRFSDKLPGWVPKLLNPGGRLVLTRSVLMALPLHFLAVLDLPVWALKIIYRRCRGFVWRGQEDTNGGHCLLPWSRVCMPLKNGGLGVLNLRYFSCAMRSRWPWLRWSPTPRPWSLIPLPDDTDATALVNAASFVRLGNGNRAMFWTDKWRSDKRSVCEAFPQLASFVKNSGITVAQALLNNRWVRDIKGGISMAAMGQYLLLWEELLQLRLDAGTEDVLVWCHSTDGTFSTNSAYQLFFAANTIFPCANAIWKSKAPARCKFFMWLAVHQRCLTADNLQSRGWPNSGNCQLCNVEPETCVHLFVHCRFTS